MAIAAAYQTVATVTSTAGTVYTTPSTTASFAYGRDLVITNNGAVTVFVGIGAANVTTTAAGLGIPAGASLVITQGAVAQAVPISAITASATTSLSIGFASVVSIV